MHSNELRCTASRDIPRLIPRKSRGSKLGSIPNIATLAQMETNEIFWPKRGTCGLNPSDVGLVGGGLQRCEGCRRAP
jgi:hypothetical protein